MSTGSRMVLQLLLAALLVTTFTLTAAAQEDPRLWDTDDVALRQGTFMEWHRNYAINDDGWVCFVWSDTRTGDRDIYAQLIDAEGNNQWDDSGLRVSLRTIREEEPEICAVEDGWIIAWVQYTETDPWSGGYQSTIYAQKLNSAGVAQWGTYGVPVHDAGFSFVNEESLVLSPQADGGVLIGWHENSVIGAQLVNGNGSPQWPFPIGVSNSATEYWEYKGVAGSEGSLLFVWKSYVNGVGSQIHAARVEADGSLPWGSGLNGIILADSLSSPHNLRVCSDAATGGLYCAWRDLDLRMRRVAGDGSLTWGGTFCDATGQRSLWRIASSFNEGEQDGCFAVWEDWRDDFPAFYAHKILASGEGAWIANGIPVCTDEDNYLFNPWLISDESGGAIISWSDTRGESWHDYADIYAARFDAAGTSLWGECGTPVLQDSLRQDYSAVVLRPAQSDVLAVMLNAHAGSNDLESSRLNLSDGSPIADSDFRHLTGLDGSCNDIQAVSLGDNRVAVVWHDYRPHYGSIYFQIVNHSAQVYLEEYGRLLAPDNEEFETRSQDDAALCSDENGGFFAAFEDRRTGDAQIRVVHVNHDGQLLCDDAGVQLSESIYDSRLPQVVADGSGGCFVAWIDYTDQFVERPVVMRIDASCNPLWQEPVRFVSEELEDWSLNEIIASDESSCILSWRSGTFQEYDIMAARVFADGTIDWTIAVCDEELEQSRPAMISDGNGGAFIAWQDKRDPFMNADIYAQHLAVDGSELWAHNGIAVNVIENAQYYPRLLRAPSNGLYVIWSDFRSEDDFDIYAQRLNADGEKLWLETGLPIVVAPGEQSSPRMIANNLGGFVCVWEDEREDYSDIYAADLTPEGTVTRNWWLQSSGGPVTSADFTQEQPAIAPFDEHSALVAWIDWRTTAFYYGDRNQTEWPLSNAYMQRITTGLILDAGEEPSLPQAFALRQNYPNPFNPTTTIEFSLAQAAHTQLAVFDLLGREVAVLVNEPLAAGTHVANFEASDLPSGVYFYKLDAGTFHDTKKMIVLK